ncbi:MAG: hypothetical protein ACO1OQ_04800, partial [Rufibacter sp.]
MKRALLFPLILLLAIILPSANGFCQARRDTINIDLGRGNRTTAGGWNNLIDQKAGAIGNLINSRGNNTGVSVAVTDPFNSINEANYAADDSLNIPLSASRDSFWGSTNFLEGAQEPTGGVTFSNLQVGTAYNFEFFASRGNVTNNRVSKYVVEGTTRQEVNLNASRNTSNVVRVRNVMPKADGAITVTAMEGVGNNDPNGTFFLGVIKVNYLNSVDPGPKSVKVKFPNGAEELKAGKPARITWERNNIGAIDIQYSIDNG